MNDYQCPICKTDYDAYMQKYECEIICTEAIKFNKQIIAELKALPRYNISVHNDKFTYFNLVNDNKGRVIEYSDLYNILSHLK